MHKADASTAVSPSQSATSNFVLHKIFRVTFLASFLLLHAAASLAQNSRAEKDCRQQIGKSLREWSVSSVTREVADWAKSHGVKPTSVHADLDGDGVHDIALLIQNRLHPILDYPERADSSLVAVCLIRPATVVLHLLRDPYCSDLITLSRKGQRYFDFEAGRKGIYPSDGVKTVCFEKASATYVYQKQNESFRRIIDGD